MDKCFYAFESTRNFFFRNSLVEMSMHRHRQHATNTRSIAVSVLFHSPKETISLWYTWFVCIFFIINNDGDRFNVYNSALCFCDRCYDSSTYIYIFILLVSFVHMTQYTPIKILVPMWMHIHTIRPRHSYIWTYTTTTTTVLFHMSICLIRYLFSSSLSLSVYFSCKHWFTSCRLSFVFSTCNFLLSNANDQKKK